MDWWQHALFFLTGWFLPDVLRRLWRVRADQWKRVGSIFQTKIQALVARLKGE